LRFTKILAEAFFNKVSEKEFIVLFESDKFEEIESLFKHRFNISEVEKE